MGEGIDNYNPLNNKESNEGRRYFEYVLETYPTLFKRYEEVTKDHPEKRVAAMQEAFIYIGLHMHDVLDAGVLNIYGDNFNIMDLDGGPNSPQMKPLFDNVFKGRGFDDTYIDGKLDPADLNKLEEASGWMNYYVNSLEEIYQLELKGLDREISEIKSRTRNTNIKEKVLNVIPAHHIMKAVRSDSSNEDQSKGKIEGQSDTDRLIELELKRTKVKNTLFLSGSLKGKDFMSMEPLDRINTLSIYFQFMIESAQNAIQGVINSDYVHEIKRKGQPYDIY